jgi:hypothetical protein
LTTPIAANRGGQVREDVELLQLTRARDGQQAGDGEFALGAAIAEHDLAPLSRVPAYAERGGTTPNGVPDVGAIFKRPNAGTRHSLLPATLQTGEEGEELVIGAKPARHNRDRRGLREDLFFQREIGVQIDLSRFHGLVTEPQRDDGAIDAGLQ